MKKSKVIIPALGVLILSTAASVTGTVAWFTANRTTTITAGDFAVVKTSNDLAVSLAAGVGTGVSDHAVTVNSGCKLTDASFDHTATSAPKLPIITPNVPREKYLKCTSLTDGSLATELVRGDNVYSAFTWKMTFTLTFSEGALKKQGLFIDLSDDGTYMKEVCKPTGHTDNKAEGTWYTDLEMSEAATPTAGNYYQYVAKGGESASGWYTNPECNSAAAGTLTKGTTYYQPGLAADTTYYRLPDHTGKAFRIAFVPSDIPTGSMGYAKVWAGNETSQSAHDLNALQYTTSGTAGTTLSSTDYGSGTVSLTGGTIAAGTLASASAKTVLMKSGDATAIPDDSSLSSAEALNDGSKGKSNYLGYFGASAGNEVSLEFTCVAWYEGSHPEIYGSATDFEMITTSMVFGVSELTD